MKLQRVITRKQEKGFCICFKNAHKINPAYKGRLHQWFQILLFYYMHEMRTLYTDNMLVYQWWWSTQSPHLQLKYHKKGLGKEPQKYRNTWKILRHHTWLCSGKGIYSTSWSLWVGSYTNWAMYLLYQDTVITTIPC